MRYTVKLGGLGLKFKLIEIDKDQYNFLKKSDVEKDKLSIEEVSKYLNINFNDLDSNFGVSWGNHYIKVFKDDIELWHSDYDEDVEFQDEWINLDPNFNYSLLIEDNKEDDFYSFNLDIFDDFDPNNFIRVTKEFGNSKDIITDLKYQNKILQKNDLNTFEKTLTVFKLYKNK